MSDAIGRRIKRLREQRGFTLRALAAKAGVALSSIAAVEIGTRSGDRLSAQTCRRLAQALGVTVDYLVGMYKDEEDEESQPVGAVA
jgi:transcriptional regulator with XRE-family HTH domain